MGCTFQGSFINILGGFQQFYLNLGPPLESSSEATILKSYSSTKSLRLKLKISVTTKPMGFYSSGKIATGGFKLFLQGWESLGVEPLILFKVSCLNFF